MAVQSRDPRPLPGPEVPEGERVLHVPGASPVRQFDQATLDAIPAAVHVFDRRGRFSHCNRYARERFGVRALHAVAALRTRDGKPLHDDPQSPLTRALRTGVAQHEVPLLLEREGAEPAMVLANIQPLHDGGQPSGAIVSFHPQPVSSLPHMPPDDLEWLRAILDITPECVKVVSRDGRLLHMNPAGLRMLEADEPLVDANVLDVIAPEHRQDWSDRHQKVCAGERMSWEFDIIGLAGTRRHMETHAAPLAVPGGQDGFVQLAITRDISERKRQDAALHDSERRLRDLLEALPIAIYTTDVEGRVTYYNHACVGLAGREPEIGTDQWCVTWRLYRPDGSFLPHDQCPMAVALRETRAIHGAEALAERPDGTRVPFLAYPAPLRDRAGTVVGAVNMLVDITERKRAEDHRNLLINELNHRVKNTMVTVQSLAAQTFRGQPDSEAYRWFEGRLLALSEAHNVLSRENWESASLHEVLARVIAPLQEGNHGRFTVVGPDVRLRPKVLLSLTMVLHELCTNAVKFGALSVPGGRVAIHWHVDAGPDGGTLRAKWLESGGPVVVTPARRGFGSRLIEMGAARELNAQVRLTYASGGVACELDLPLQ